MALAGYPLKAPIKGARRGYSGPTDKVRKPFVFIPKHEHILTENCN